MLAKIPLFSGLGEADLAAIGRHAVLRTYPKNTVVICEGDFSDSLYVIHSGKVKVYASDENGKEVILSYQGAGEYFGELALLGDSRRTASVMTVDKTTFSIISKSSFLDMLARTPDVALSVIKDLIGRVRVLTDNVKNLALLDVYGRVAKTLLGMAVPQDGRLVIEGKLTQQEIANCVGASREMVARILKDLAAGGYIQIDQHRIVINEHLPARY